jgi:hypothetical protein
MILSCAEHTGLAQSGPTVKVFMADEKRREKSASDGITLYDFPNRQKEVSRGLRGYP